MKKLKTIATPAANLFGLAFIGFNPSLKRDVNCFAKKRNELYWPELKVRREKSKPRINEIK